MKHWYEHEQEFYTLLYIYGGCVHMCCIKIERLIINNNNNFDDYWYRSSFDSKMTNNNHTKLVRRKLKLKCIYLYWFLCNVLGHSLSLWLCVWNAHFRFRYWLIFIVFYSVLLTFGCCCWWWWWWPTFCFSWWNPQSIAWFPVHKKEVEKKQQNTKKSFEWKKNNEHTHTHTKVNQVINSNP